MDFLALIESPLLKLPMERTKVCFVDFAKSFLAEYESLIKQMDSGNTDIRDQRIKIIQNLNSGLIKSLEFYYLGKTADSYNLFVKAVDSIEKYLSIQTVPIKPEDNDLNNQYYFKARIGGWNRFSKSEMFIRKFDDREFIPTYRYSIPGLPCLYLSSTIKTAWQELGKPDINSMQVSLFELNLELKRLYFAISIKNFLDIGDLSGDKLVLEKNIWDYLTYFPLHALCSIRVKELEAHFKPEYVFPQFLMQWIRRKNIDMIEFMSTKSDPTTKTFNQSWDNCNLAIPAQSLHSVGHCPELQKKIKFTEPISWQELHNTYPKFEFQKRDNPKPVPIGQYFKSIVTQVEFIPTKSQNYADTTFGIMEEFLIQDMNTDYLTVKK